MHEVSAAQAVRCPSEEGHGQKGTIPEHQALYLLAGDLGGHESVDGIGTNARFAQPQDLTIDEQGNLYVADSG